MDYVNAVVRDKKTHFDFLNIPNRGAIKGLANDMIVEVPVEVDSKGARAKWTGRLPGALERMVSAAAEASHWAVEAAVHSDMTAAHRSIDADPAIADKDAARAALAEMITANQDLLKGWKT